MLTELGSGSTTHAKVLSTVDERTAAVDDSEIVHRISQLADEERALEQSHVGDGLSAEDMNRLRSVEVALDQCWDLLRQRRAQRAAGKNPEDAEVRPEGVVEGYRQ
ncbi:MAG: DUF2630 family protein [Acidimicrobiales bacterium]